MKHLLRKFMALGLAIVGAFGLKAESTTVVLDFSKNDFGFEKSSDGLLYVSYDDLNSSYPTGTNAPALPLLGFNIPLPANSTFQSCSIKVVNKVELYRNQHIAMAPTPFPTSETTVSSNEPTERYSGITSPENSLRCANVSESKFGNIAHVVLCTFEYNSATGNLYLASGFMLTVNYTTSGKSVTNDWYNPELKEMFKGNINIPLMANTGEDILLADPVDVTQTVETLDYVIVTSTNLKEAFETLKNFKNVLGVRTQIVTVEEIDGKYTGNDIQEKIKKQIQELKLRYGLKYVLLGGDANIVPTRQCYVEAPNSKDNKNPYKDFTPADNYYVCFNGSFNWDGNGNGIYGETGDGIDFSTELFISRLPLRTSEEIENYTKRLAMYCQYGNKGVNKNIMLMSGTKLWQGYAGHSDAYHKANKFYNNYIKDYWDGERVMFFDTYTDFSEGKSYDFTAQNLQSELSKGYSFVDIMTHGTPTSLSMERGVSYNTSNASTLTNSGSTIVTTMACSTNAFDNITDPCLSEALIRNTGSGVLGYLGSSRYGWGCKDSLSSGPRLGKSLLYEAAFYQNLLNEEIVYNNFAKCVTAAKMSRKGYCDGYGAERWLQFSLNPIGDPEFHIYTDTPKKLQSPTLSYAKGAVTFENVPEGANVTVASMKDFGDSFYHSIKNSMGKNLIRNVEFDVYISVTKPGYSPLLYIGKYIPGVRVGDGTMRFTPMLTPNVRPLNSDDEATIEGVKNDGENAVIYVQLTTQSQNTQVIIYDNLGNMVVTAAIDSSDGDYNVNVNLKKGFYVISLVTDGKLVDQMKFAKY